MLNTLHSQRIGWRLIFTVQHTEIRGGKFLAYDMLNLFSNFLELMLSCGMNCYHLGWNVIIWDEMLASGANITMWSKCYYVESYVIMLDEMPLYGDKCYHLELMLSSWVNVIMWSKCYYVVLSLRSPFLLFLKTSLTSLHRFFSYLSAFNMLNKIPQDLPNSIWYHGFPPLFLTACIEEVEQSRAKKL